MLNITNWTEKLRANLIPWLLAPDEPGVRYLVLRDIVEADEKEIRAAKRKAHCEGPIARILENMAQEGYWIKPGPGYLPKFTSIVWSIISLAQLGASREEDKRIDIACSYLLW